MDGKEKLRVFCFLRWGRIKGCLQEVGMDVSARVADPFGSEPFMPDRDIFWRLRKFFCRIRILT